MADLWGRDGTAAGTPAGRVDVSVGSRSWRRRSGSAPDGLVDRDDAVVAAAVALQPRRVGRRRRPTARLDPAPPRPGVHPRTVGLAPKRFARVRRFQRWCAPRRPRSRRTDWSRLAAETGYHDQAHLIHDFRDLSGLTPAPTGRARRASTTTCRFSLQSRADACRQ
jgi:AraC-like DNA-binding protein